MKSRHNYGIGQGKTAVSPEERWKSKIATRPELDCQLWKGKHNKYNRSTFYAGRVQWDTMDYAWFLHYGESPGYPLERICGNKRCVYWAHLREKKQTKSTRQQVSLDKESVIEIRRRYRAGEKIKMIAKEWPEASEQSVYLAAVGKTYKWVTDVE